MSLPAADLDVSDHDACFRAAAGRESRFDGRLYLGVTTTGIYCRPSCPARTPLPKNCQFFLTAAAAVAGGFRPCKRCRPDALPGSRGWDTRGDLVARAIRLIRDGAVDDDGVAGLAERLAVSERHLNRMLVTEVGASPQQLNRTRRAHTARTLIDQTTLPLTDIAFAAGFGSIRQFNDVMRAEFSVAPSAHRRPPTAGPTVDSEDDRVSDQAPTVVLRLRHRAPLATEPLRRFLAAHAVVGLDSIDPVSGEHTRAMPAPGGAAEATIMWGEASDHVVVRILVHDLVDLMGVVGRVRRWLDLDSDPELVDSALRADPLLEPLVVARPGLRIPGAVDGAETALFAVLGQQVSLRAARTFQARLVAGFGTVASEADVADAHLPTSDLPQAFLSPLGLVDVAAVAAADTEHLRSTLGITQGRVRALQGVAIALADGLALDSGADRIETRRRLLGLWGIGPWTTDYIALRCLGDPDAYPAGDLVLQKALGVTSARAAEARGESWHPWRGYALLHLWTKEVFS